MSLENIRKNYWPVETNVSWKVDGPEREGQGDGQG